MIKRIKSLISVKNLTASQFADLLGVQRSNISHIISGRNKPSLDFILKITEVYPDVSLDWILKGQGEMFISGNKSDSGLAAQLEMHVPDSISEDNIKSDTNEKREISSENEFNPENMKSVTELFPDMSNENTKGRQSPLPEPDKSGIEQIMVLYKNGSFRVYTPQK